MKLPPPDPGTVRRFEEMAPKGTAIELRKVFGQPSAFVGGNMFFSVFGDRLILRLSDEDRALMIEQEGAVVFEPMPGRPMKQYVCVPVEVASDDRQFRPWVARSLSYAKGLPAKSAGPRRPKNAPTVRARR